MSHFQENCIKCGVLISQCRCADCSKVVISGLCNKCGKGKVTDSEPDLTKLREAYVDYITKSQPDFQMDKFYLARLLQATKEILGE